MRYNIFMSQKSSGLSILSSLSIRDIDYALRSFDEVKETVAHALKTFPIDETLKAKVEAAKQIEWVQRPAIYIEPMPVVESGVVTTNTVVTLCLDTKHSELYEYDNYHHRKHFSKKAEQQFKILRKVCEAEGSYVKTADLMKISKYKTIGATYKSIEKINYKASSIGLPDKLVVGSQGDGYRLNPDYRVSVV